MARREDKKKAIELRKKGMSYSQIKEKVGVSKSTLSTWLSEFPLSAEKIRLLRDVNPKRIEKFRNTMQEKRTKRHAHVYQVIEKDIGALSKREIFLCGFFLYWGEGYKTARYKTALANTDPFMMKFFLKWLLVLGVPQAKIKARIHVYPDMDKKVIKDFWCTELSLSEKNVSLYMKKAKSKKITYKGGFGYGTCNLYVGGRDLQEYVIEGIHYLQKEASFLK